MYILGMQRVQIFAFCSGWVIKIFFLGPGPGPISKHHRCTAGKFLEWWAKIFFLWQLCYCSYYYVNLSKLILRTFRKTIREKEYTTEGKKARWGWSLAPRKFFENTLHFLGFLGDLVDSRVKIYMRWILLILFENSLSYYLKNISDSINILCKVKKKTTHLIVAWGLGALPPPKILEFSWIFKYFCAISWIWGQIYFLI